MTTVSCSKCQADNENLQTEHIAGGSTCILWLEVRSANSGLAAFEATSDASDRVRHCCCRQCTLMHAMSAAFNDGTAQNRNICASCRPVPFGRQPLIFGGMERFCAGA